MPESHEILVAEDYEPDRDLLSLEFKRNRVANRIHFVSDGTAVLDFLYCRGAYGERSFERLPGVLILDIRMPSMNGWEVVWQMRGDSRMRNIPVVIVADLRSTGSSRLPERIGVLAYLQKPMRFDDLREALAPMGFVWVYSKASS